MRKVVIALSILYSILKLSLVILKLLIVLAIVRIKVMINVYKFKRELRKFMSKEDAERITRQYKSNLSLLTFSIRKLLRSF